jgi:hypothetical protein
MVRTDVCALAISTCLSLVTPMAGTSAGTSAGAASAAPSVDVTVRVLDLDGRLASADEVRSIMQDDITDMGGTEIPVTNGVAHFDTQPGRYSYYATVASRRAPHTAFLSLLDVPITKATTLTLDARQATTAAVSVPRSDARLTQAAVSLCYGPSPVDNRCWQTEGAVAASLSDIAFSPTKGRVSMPAPLTLTVQALFDAGGSSPAASPSTYHVAVHSTNVIPRHPRWRLRADQFATVPTTYYAQRPGTEATIEHWSTKEGGDTYGELTERVRLPARRTEYYQAGPRWARSLHLAAVGTTTDTEVSDVVRYRPGPAAPEHWDQAVRGPGLSARDDRPGLDTVLPQITRMSFDARDVISGFPDLYADPQRRFSFYASLPQGMSGDYALYEDGVQLPLTPRLHRWTLTKPKAAYRLTAHLDNASPNDVLSRDVSAQWTFTSAHQAARSVTLPLTAITLTPQVDEANRARADRPTPISLDTYRQPGAPSAPLTSLTLSVSFDDGRTWRQIPVSRSGAGGHAEVPKPPQAGAGFVSVQVAAGAADGTTVTERIIRAYRLGA